MSKHRSLSVEIRDVLDERLLPFEISHAWDKVPINEVQIEALKRGKHLEIKYKGRSIILYRDNDNMRLDKYKILDYLENNSQMFKEEYQLKSMGLFGSYARDKATPDSDINIIVEFRKKAKSLRLLGSLLEKLEKDLDKKIDLVWKHSKIRSNHIDTIGNIVFWVFRSEKDHDYTF